MLTRYITKFNTLCRLIIVGLLIYPIPAFGYHVPTQAPSNLTLTVDYENGTVKADWDASDQMEDYPAERYAIGFGLSDEVSLPYGIATGNVGDSNALNTEYTFTASYLNTVFNETHGLFHVAVRSDNDTNSSYSDWTPTVSVTIQNKPSAVSIATYDMNREDGIKFEWLASTSGFVTASTYKMYYKLASASAWTLAGQQSNTDYVLTWDNLTDDTYDFMLSACGSENDCNDSSTLSIDVVLYVAPTTTTTTTSTTTTTTTTLPPPPPTTTTTLAPVIVKIGGEEVEYTQSELDDGTVDRDIERQENEDKYGCYMTNAQIDRGDCDIPKEEEKKEEVIIVIEDEQDTKTELSNDDDVVLDVADKDEDKNIIDEPTEKIIVVDENLELTDQEKKELTEVIKEIQKQDLDQFAIEDEVIVFDLPEIIEIEQENLDEEKDTKPIKEVVEQDEIVDIIPDRQEEMGERNNETPLDELTDEQQEEVIKQVEQKIQVVEITENTTEAEIVEAVEALPVEEKIEVVKEVAKVKVQNLDKATEETKQIVQAVIVEVTKPETVAELSEEEKEVVAEVLGLVETNDVVIIAEQSVEDETIATAVQEYVERATENADVEDYGIQNVIVEVGIEEFINDPLGQLLDIDLSGVVLSDIGSDMPEAVKTQAAKTVVPVIIVGQIIATPFTRRF